MQSKHYFDEVFEQSDFTGVGRMAHRYKNKKIMKDKHGKVVYEDSICLLGISDDDFLKEQIYTTIVSGKISGGISASVQCHTQYKMKY
jgi:hypothetical protein